jgi:hypothetical protein
MIQAVLQDAEEKQWTSKQTKVWLRDLKNAAYDVDDVLDEFAIEARRNRLRSFFSLVHNQRFRLKMAHKLKNVREKMDSITNVKIMFDLTPRTRNIAADMST